MSKKNKLIKFIDTIKFQIYFSMKDNLVFLTESELDRPLYRIFSFQRLEEIFQENKLTLVKPRLWEDPFENFILNSIGYLPDGREFQIGFRDNFYGQCWSLTKESDAMWRIYSPKKNGVKVKTTIRKLFTPLFQAGGKHTKNNGIMYNLSSFVGKVKYANTKTLTTMLKDEKRMSDRIFDQSGWGQASTFFFKRVAFQHEKEVRLIYNSQHDNQFDTFKFEIVPNDIFDEIVFDPRMNLSDYQEMRSKLLSWGYQNKIIQSGLYKIKTFTISLRSL
ncbi:MAG: hypothetical protein B7Y37_04590 [Sphingobacteriia bacterium 28-36-52]|nr:MAG: hypothetical protein B7Y37_04590 [Sphingobacteriia bacterium 28-36-52]